MDDSTRTNKHVTTKTLTKEIRDAMRPKFTWRPYVLRAYFDTQLLIAKNNGKMAHARAIGVVLNILEQPKRRYPKIDYKMRFVDSFFWSLVLMVRRLMK